MTSKDIIRKGVDFVIETKGDENINPGKFNMNLGDDRVFKSAIEK